MEQAVSFGCECEDDFHFGQACAHGAASFQATGGELVALCPCCAHHKHMTAKGTRAPDAEQEACAAR